MKSLISACFLYSPGQTCPLIISQSKRKKLKITGPKAEEIVEPEEFRKDPMRTTIPYFLVDAVVHAPFGAYPGAMPARYEIDLPHIDILNGIQNEEQMQTYLHDTVYSVSDHEEFLDRRVGSAKMKELRGQATIIEGYR